MASGYRLGDVNLDKKVNLVDFSLISAGLNKKNPPLKLDLNKDGRVDLKDLSILAENWTG